MQIGVIKCFLSLYLSLVAAFLRYRGKISRQGGNIGSIEHNAFSIRS